MNPWFGFGVFIAGTALSVVIRVPHDRRSQETKVTQSRKGTLEIALLAAMALGLLILPVVAMATSWLAFADYPLHPVAFALGALAMAAGLWVFHRAHADLGRNWSVTLEIRESHALVTQGVYRSVRHPMYSAIYLLALAQALLVPNFIAGPACLVAFTLMFALRVPREERMMLDAFGGQYRDYASRTRRVIPGVW